MRGRLLSGIGFRIALPAFGVICVLAVVLAVAQARLVRNRTGDTLDRYSDLVSELVLTSLRDGMEANDLDRLEDEVSYLSAIEHILRVQVVNKDGEIIFANEEQEIGSVLDIGDPSCQACHADADEPSDRAGAVHYVSPTERYFRAVQPIRAEESCLRCHQVEEDAVLGVLITDLDERSLTGLVRRDADRAFWLVVGAFLLLTTTLVLAVRLVVTGRLRDLRKLIDLLRLGTQSRSIVQGSKDEIGELEMLVRALAEDLEDRGAVTTSAARFASVLEHSQGPAIVYDSTGAILAANREAIATLRPADATSEVGTQRSSWSAHAPSLVDAARETGWAISDDAEGPIVVQLAGESQEELGFLELWPTPPGRDDADIDEAPLPVPLLEATADWLLYASAVLESISAAATRWGGVLRLDPRIAAARSRVSELQRAASQSISERIEVDLSSLVTLSVWEMERQKPAVHWHTMTRAEAVVGARHQLRALVLRAARAAGEQVQPGGHVVVFTQHDPRRGLTFVGAWAGGSGSAVQLDPSGLPPLARAVGRSHGGGVEVDPSFDFEEFARARSIRMPCDPIGVLFVAELGHRRGGPPR